MAHVYIPTSWRTLTGGRARLDLAVSDVAGLVEALEGRFPGFRRELVDDSGNFHRFVNVYVNDREIDELEGLQTRLEEDDQVAVIPAMAGGATARPFTPQQAGRYARHIIL